MKDEEILELGADGTFSIPSPSKKAIKETKPLVPTKTAVVAPSKPVTPKVTATPPKPTEPEPTPKKEAVKASSTTEPQKTKTTDVHDLLNSVSPGEYKVYRDGTTVNVIVCLQDEQKVSSMSMTDTQIRLLISDTIPKELIVPLPMTVNPQTATCRTFKSFVTLQATVSSSQ